MLRTDLVPKEAAERWLKHLREELPTLAFKSSQQKQKSRLGQRRLPKLKARCARQLAADQARMLSSRHRTSSHRHDCAT